MGLGFPREVRPRCVGGCPSPTPLTLPPITPVRPAAQPGCTIAVSLCLAPGQRQTLNKSVLKTTGAKLLFRQRNTVAQSRTLKTPIWPLPRQVASGSVTLPLSQVPTCQTRMVTALVSQGWGTSLRSGKRQEPQGVRTGKVRLASASPHPSIPRPHPAATTSELQFPARRAALHSGSHDAYSVEGVRTTTPGMPWCPPLAQVSGMEICEVLRR